MPGVRSLERGGLIRGRSHPAAVERPNSGMHPTADTTAVIKPRGAARRVMPGVRLLVRSEEFCCWMRGRGGWRRREVEAVPAVVGGLTSWAAGGGRRGGARVSSSPAWAAWRALKMTQSNKRMHATRDTSHVINL
jgi:hypothetical protein